MLQMLGKKKPRIKFYIFSLYMALPTVKDGYGRQKSVYILQPHYKITIYRPYDYRKISSLIYNIVIDRITQIQTN